MSLAQPIAQWLLEITLLMNDRQGLGSLGKRNSHCKARNLLETVVPYRISCAFLPASNLSDWSDRFDAADEPPDADSITKSVQTDSKEERKRR
jgi:hypothetical protein